jgi:putative endopeptidase
MRRLLHAASVLTIAVSAACAGTEPVPEGPPAPSVLPPISPQIMVTMKLEETGIDPTWMDRTADPCDSFFAYACGGFVKNTVIPSDRASWGVTEMIQKSNEDFLRDVLERDAKNPGEDPVAKKIGDYYAACMDEDGIEKAGIAPIKPLLDVVAKVSDPKTLADAVTSLHAATVFSLFDISAQQDFKDATKMIAGLDQNGLGLPDRDYYLKDDGNIRDVRDFYRGHVGRMLALLGEMPAEVKVATADVMRIETKIAKLEQDKVTRRDPYKIYHRVDRAGLTSVAKGFPWDAYFKGLGFPGIEEISVNDPAYFTGIDALIHEEKPAAWRHYLAWQVAHEKARSLTKAFQNEAFLLRQKISGQKEIEPRWKRCVRSVDTSLGELLAQPYIAAKFAGDSKARAQDLVHSIHEAMRNEFALLPWMDDATRAAAVTKMDKMHDKVGYPDHWRIYDFEVSRTSHAANVMAAERFDEKRRLTKVGKPVDKTEWEMTPPTVNAYYDSSLNEIVLPAGELQPPFFSKDFYAPVNIGDEGANTIGHEITHGFDDEGCDFDGDGNLRNWWTKETKAKFDLATKCVQDQYSAYEAVPGVKLNGELTSGENIADIGGVKLGYAALLAWKKSHGGVGHFVQGFTDEKLYFLGYAQGWCSKETPEILEMYARTNPHSPPRWRVDGPMADNPSFAEAFQCKEGAKERPPQACSVW